MSALAIRILAYVLGAAGVLGAAYYGIDTVVGAFRERAALQAQVAQQQRAAEKLNTDLAQARADADQARQDAQRVAEAAKAEIALRDRLAREAKAREATNAKELRNAKDRLARWMREATPDLQRCLAMPVPDDVVVGLREQVGEAGPSRDVHAEDGDRALGAAGGIPAGRRGSGAEGGHDRREAGEPARTARRAPAGALAATVPPGVGRWTYRGRGTHPTEGTETMKPSLGRVVIVRTVDAYNGSYEHPAVINRVWGDGDPAAARGLSVCVNVTVLPDHGTPFCLGSVSLFETKAEALANNSSHVAWWPERVAPGVVESAAAGMLGSGNSSSQREPTAPRVTQANVDAAIASEWYINAGDGVVPDSFQPPVPAEHPLRQLTFCVLVLRNGFTVTGESACVSAENFDAEIGRRLARESAVEKVWPLLGYALADRLAAGPDKGSA